VGFVLSFTLLPAGLMLLSPGRPATLRDLTDTITGFLAALIDRHSRTTLIIYGLLSAAFAAGATRLTVENRFIDYYRESTEIYQGMELIDRELGGTTPLDVIVNATPSPAPREPADPAREEPAAVPGADNADADEALAREFEAEYEDGAGGITTTSHWLNSHRLGDVARIHDYLDGLPQTGKVISLMTTIRLLEKLDPSIADDDFLLSVVYQRLPDDVKAELITPYLSADGDQLRFAVRVFETDPTLRRQQLLDAIREHLTGELGLQPDQLHLSGMLVLYNNMLLSLFRSQILTLGAVFLAIMLMFLILFRSLRLALIAVIPNIVAGIFVLGLMGWLDIPLDIMTITIAAITIGISVDDTIHYVCRFRKEFEIDRQYWPAIHRCHATIGRAMYYTSVVIMMGFSILALSNFVPTIYFGVLTGCAMIVALLADLTLLPVLLVACRGGASGRLAMPVREEQDGSAVSLAGPGADSR